jgi:hypothetical protein
MNTSPRIDVGRAPAQLEFRALERFPCGCVAIIQQTRPNPITIVSIDAKGPHCILPSHSAGKVVRLGDAWDLAEFDDGE